MRTPWFLPGLDEWLGMAVVCAVALTSFVVVGHYNPAPPAWFGAGLIAGQFASDVADAVVGDSA